MATFDPDEPTRFGAWCDALGYPCASYGGLKVSQPSSSFICVPLVVGYVYFGIKILVENARKGTHWAWCDDHLADYVGTAHCRAERLPDHSTRERCNFLYGVALLLMAACMVFAGANYQAFTWQLHCEGADAACIKNPARDLEPAELPRYDADHSWCGILYNWLQVLSVYVWVLGDFYRASRAHVRHALAMGVAMPLLFALFIACIPVHGQARAVLRRDAVHGAGVRRRGVALAARAVRAAHGGPRRGPNNCERGHVHTRRVRERGARVPPERVLALRLRRAAHPPLPLLRAPLVGVATRRGRAARLPSHDGGPARPAENRAGRGGARVTIEDI